MAVRLLGGVFFGCDQFCGRGEEGGGGGRGGRKGKSVFVTFFFSGLIFKTLSSPLIRFCHSYVIITDAYIFYIKQNRF